LHLSILTSRNFKAGRIEEAIVDGCLQTDRIILQQQHSIGDFSGSTAVFVLFDADLPAMAAAATTAATKLPTSGRFFVGNIGDSRCVLSANGGVAEVLTIDHKATREDERARVEAAGAMVINNRIAGVLAVTRSFGDIEFKVLPPGLESLDDGSSSGGTNGSSAAAGNGNSSGTGNENDNAPSPTAAGGAISITTTGIGGTGHDGGATEACVNRNAGGGNGLSPVLAVPEVVERRITPKDEFLVLGTVSF
jgi:serine/threonine protein phosphatase PrpC